MSNSNHILKNIQNLIRNSDNILIVVSTPIDPDCVGTALALCWWLTKHNKQAQAISFFQIPQKMADFPGISEILQPDSSTFEFNKYQLIILVDGSSWGQFFGNNWKKILQTLNINKIVNLDHHVPDEIQAAIPERSLNVQTSCTSQLLFEYFIKPDDIKPPSHIAEYLYLSLLYDSRMFKNEIHPGEYQFAQELLCLGINHSKAVDTNYSLQEVKFLAWAIEHTQFIPNLKLTLLLIDAKLNNELQQRFGESWKDFDAIYKETIQRQITGYNYGIILIDNMDGTTRLGWRTRNFGNTICISETAAKAGFRAGGHRNAGGGTFIGSIEKAKEQLLQEIRKALKG